MKTFNCKKCGKFMGEMELGKIRNGTVILCSNCWDMASAAIQMAEMARNQTKGADLPDFFNGIFNKETPK